MAPCGVCKNEREVVQEIFRQSGDIKLCSDPCFSAYKFVNGVDTLECCLCSKHFDTKWPRVYIYSGGLSRLFCSKPCQVSFPCPPDENDSSFICFAECLHHEGAKDCALLHLQSEEIQF